MKRKEGMKKLTNKPTTPLHRGKIVPCSPPLQQPPDSASPSTVWAMYPKKTSFEAPPAGDPKKNTCEIPPVIYFLALAALRRFASVIRVLARPG